MNWLRLRWKAVTGTVFAIFSGIYFAAVMYPQPDVAPLNPPAISIQGEKSAVLTSDYYRVVGAYRITVKKGFKFDGASIPSKPDLSEPLGLDRFSPCILAAALLHDALYASELLSQQEADSILYACALQDGTEAHKAKAIWRAVHDCGAIIWSRHTEKSIAEARKLVSVCKV